jgi:RNA polymerase sigma factor (sigma-70 family)
MVIQDNLAERLFYNTVHHSDHQAFGQLYKLLKASMMDFAIALVKERWVADELVQDTFVNFWKQKGTITEEVLNVKLYFLLKVKEAGISYLQSARKQEVVDMELLDTSHLQLIPDPEQLFINAEIGRIIQQAVDSLPGVCKLIYTMVRVDGLKYKDVAFLLNMPAKTVESKMMQAVKSMGEAVKLSLGERITQ